MILASYSYSTPSVPPYYGALCGSASEMTPGLGGVARASEPQ
jgi:hypothetical protein